MFCWLQTSVGIVPETTTRHALALQLSNKLPRRISLFIPEYLRIVLLIAAGRLENIRSVLSSTYKIQCVQCLGGQCFM